jgi:hypothetical protein
MVDEKNIKESKEEVVDDKSKTEEPKVEKTPEKPTPVQPKPAPTPKPTIKTNVAPKAKNRIDQEIEDYITKVNNKKSKEAVRRLWNIFEYISKKPEDANLEAVLGLFKDKRETILLPEVVFASAGALTLSQNTKLSIGYTLFKALANNTKLKQGVYSADMVKQEFGETAFIWFNKKFPKKTFV